MADARDSTSKRETTVRFNPVRTRRIRRDVRFRMRDGRTLTIPAITAEVVPDGA